jgi:hypothetical protein
MGKAFLRIIFVNDPLARADLAAIQGHAWYGGEVLDGPALKAAMLPRFPEQAAAGAAEAEAAAAAAAAGAAEAEAAAAAAAATEEATAAEEAASALTENTDDAGI